MLFTVFSIVQFYGSFTFEMGWAADERQCRVSMVFQQCGLDPQVMSLLKANWSRRPSRNFKEKKELKQLVERLDYLQRTYERIPNFILQQISILQMMLARIGELNHPEVQQDENLQVDVLFTNFE